MISRKKKSNVIETDFLPSVLEVLETPPLKGGRIVSFSITVFILLFLGWSFSFIDVVSVAQGKVIPLGNVKIIQPQEQGKITEISVIEGQKVKQGDILLKLDKTLAEAELEKIYLEQKKIEDDILLLTAYNARYSSMAVTRENDLLQAKKREFFFNLKTLQDELAKSQSTVNIVEASIVELKATLPVISEKYKSYETLYQQGHVSKVEFLNLKEQKIQREQEYASQLQRRNQALADIQKVKSQIEALKSSDKRAVSEELSEKRVKLSQLKEENKKASEHLRWETITSPVEGIVQQIKVHTIGGIVTPAQELMTIVPVDRVLEVEAYLPNKDIAFVRAGQTVRIKIDSLPFTKYGILQGKVITVSTDAVFSESGGFIYPVKIAIPQSDIQAFGKKFPLSMGMTVVAEIQTDRRRLIDYFFSPIARYQDEALRER